MTDDELRKMWRTAGGSFHGPNIETGTMPESQLLPFLRDIAAAIPAQAADQQPIAYEYYEEGKLVNTYDSFEWAEHAKKMFGGVVRPIYAPVSADARAVAIYQQLIGAGWYDVDADRYNLITDPRIKRIVYSAHDAAPAFQPRVQPWMMACFGAEISADKTERNHRFYEEATETVQTRGMTRSECHQLVDYTFNRPVGELKQEVGGVMVTLAALCLANDIDMHDCGETELARIWTKVEQIRAKQAAKPKHSPLPEHVPAPSPEVNAPVAHFLFDQEANTWHQVDAGYENDPDVVPLHAPAGWKP